MIRAIIDTSVLIRYLIKPSAAIKELIEERWLGDEVQMVTALDLIAELEGVLKRDYIQTLIRTDEGQALLDAITQKANILPALGPVPAYTRDPKDDKFVGLNRRFDQLAETRDAEARCDVGRILFVALGLAVVDDAAALGRGNAHHQVEVVLLRELAPAVDHVAVVLGRRGQAGAVVDPVVVEEDAKDLVSLLQCRLGEQIGAVRGLMLVRPFVDLNR